MRSDRVKNTTLSVERCAFVGDYYSDMLFEHGTQGRVQNCTLSADLCTSNTFADDYVDDLECSADRSLPVYVDESSRTPPRDPSLGVTLTADDSFPPLSAAPDVFAGANDTALVAIQQVRFKASSASVCWICAGAQRACVWRRPLVVACSAILHLPR